LLAAARLLADATIAADGHIGPSFGDDLSAEKFTGLATMAGLDIPFALMPLVERVFNVPL